MILELSLTVEYYSAMKRNEIVPFAEMWMDLEMISQSEVRKKKNRCCVMSLICGQHITKVVQMNLFAKQK